MSTTICGSTGGKGLNIDFGLAWSGVTDRGSVGYGAKEFLDWSLFRGSCLSKYGAFPRFLPWRGLKPAPKNLTFFDLGALFGGPVWLGRVLGKGSLGSAGQIVSDLA